MLLQLPLEDAPHYVARVHRQVVRRPAHVVHLLVVPLEGHHRLRALLVELEHLHALVVRERVELAPVRHLQHTRLAEAEVPVHGQVPDQNVHEVDPRLAGGQQVQSRRVQAHPLDLEVEVLVALDGHLWSAHLGS